MNTYQTLKKLGYRIKEIREAKGVSQQDLAFICIFEKANMSRIEADRTNFKNVVIVKFVRHWRFQFQNWSIAKNNQLISCP